MRIHFLIPFFFLIGCSESEKKSETIRVIGEGKVRIKPDQVILTIEVAFTEPRMADAVRLSQSTVDSVVSILKTYSTSENDVKTSSVTANKHYEYNGRTEVFKGFVAQQSIDFVLNDINQFTNLTGKLLQTRISKIGQVQFTHSRRDSLFREADLLAYDDANRSARKLCDRAERKLGRLVFVTNDKGNSFNDENHSIGEINTYNKGYGGNGFKISPEVLEFRRTVVSEYVIE